MASTFNLLTAGGARFDKSKFKSDFELFSSDTRKGKRKAKADSTIQQPRTAALPHSLDLFGSHPHHVETHPPRSHKRSRSPPSHPNKRSDATSDDEASDASSSSSSSSTKSPAPPQQKITLTGPSPLPKSLHTNLPSLFLQDDHSLPSTSAKPLLKALKDVGVHSLWGVQCAVGGSLLAGHDTICVAPTGSGKTLSYVLPVMVMLKDPARVLRSKASEEKSDKAGRGIRSLVVVPTRDLARQIEGVVKGVTKGRGWRVLVLSKATERSVCESSPGTSFVEEVEESEDEDESESAEAESGDDGSGDEAESTGSVNQFENVQRKTSGLKSVGVDGVIPLGIDILIATPERLHHLISENKLDLSHTIHLILDESDRLLSPDFLPQVQPIVEACSNDNIQKCLLSATMPSGPEQIAKGWMKNGGVRVVVGIKDSAVSTISQSLLYTSTESGKLLAIQNLLTTGQLPYPSLIFTQSIERADELHKALLLDLGGAGGMGLGLRVGVIHGDLSEGKRAEVLDGFRKGEVWVLVVTEVMARGMDFKGVKVVVNYDFPQSVQSYIHRIGRTGRAGQPGRAITFVNTEDSPHVRTIANVLKASGCEVPGYMLDRKKATKNEKRRLVKVPVERKGVGGGGREVGREEGKRRKDMIEGGKRRKVNEVKR